MLQEHGRDDSEDRRVRVHRQHEFGTTRQVIGESAKKVIRDEQTDEGRPICDEPPAPSEDDSTDEHRDGIPIGKDLDTLREHDNEQEHQIEAERDRRDGTRARALGFAEFLSQYRRACLSSPFGGDSRRCGLRLASSQGQWVLEASGRGSRQVREVAQTCGHVR